MQTYVRTYRTCRFLPHVGTGSYRSIAHLTRLGWTKSLNAGWWRSLHHHRVPPTTGSFLVSRPPPRTCDTRSRLVSSIAYD
ncbi:hypothetical protein BHE74_00026745 [Ensete ventricosum]|nr:hypothetical protein BHE74_00026745 [Ensete ventricosum]RZS13653.1 hypothetical protein BHM03_00045270 [Ensete ventricosum]